jgi:hypothetical protein
VHEKLARPLPFDIRGQTLKLVSPYDTGGIKAMESDVYLGGFNHLDIDEFIEWFKGLPWNNVSDATLSLYDELAPHRLAVVADGKVTTWEL